MQVTGSNLILMGIRPPVYTNITIIIIIIYINSGLGKVIATYINPFPLCGCECCFVATLTYLFSKSTRVSLTCDRYGFLLTLRKIWLSLNTGQSFIVPFRRTIIVSSRPYSQMVSKENRKFRP